MSFATLALTRHQFGSHHSTTSLSSYQQSRHGDNGRRMELHKDHPTRSILFKPQLWVRPWFAQRHSAPPEGCAPNRSEEQGLIHPFPPPLNEQGQNILSRHEELCIIAPNQQENVFLLQLSFSIRKCLQLEAPLPKP